MITPRRLLDEGTQFERDVLASARLDTGSNRGRKGAVLAMSAAVLSAATSAAPAAATAGAAAGAAATLGGAGVLVKWIGVGVVVLGAATGASVRVVSSRHATADTTSSQAAAQARAVAPNVAPAATAMASAVPLPSSGAIAPTRTDGGSVRPASSWANSSRSVVVRPALPLAAAPISELPPDVQAEVSALGRARDKLVRREAGQALRELDAYERSFPSGVLSDEATVIRVDALTQQGDQVAAVALGRRYLTAHPASPHAPHLRAVIDGVHNP
jgi:hypothetical protein